MGPLVFKGGRYADIYKGTGDRRNCAMSRSIFLANGISKQHHRLVRAELLPYLQRYSPEIVCALKGRGTDLGAHYIRLIQEWASEERFCCAIIFFDIVSAYSVVLRELAFGACSGEAVAALLQRLGRPGFGARARELSG